MSLLKTAAAVEDTVLDTMKMAEDAVIHTARSIADGFEPFNKYLPELPARRLVPAPAEVVENAYGFIEGLTANLRDFTDRLVALIPNKIEARPTAAKITSKAHAA